uniref:uncharacterized protein LOC120334326 n=1 Tax=Styela clava TaxID=7725 RepID=UPI00193A0C64|nr:uncharacterized protein LOC120334326 [Styela clava]
MDRIRSRTSHAANAILAEKLFTAIKTERIDDVEKYLCLGADPNYVLLNGITPFHLASGCSLSYEFSKMILEYGGNPNVRNKEGITPLHVATLWGKTECMKLLLENGANLHCTDNDGNDLRWFSLENGSSECMSLVDQFMTNSNEPKTPKSSKRGDPYADSWISINKENRKPKVGDIGTKSSESPISIRSPLHGQCDDSWIMKQRGSSRRRFDSNKSSRENSPAKSPLITKESSKINNIPSTRLNACTKNCSSNGDIKSESRATECSFGSNTPSSLDLKSQRNSDPYQLVHSHKRPHCRIQCTQETPLVLNHLCRGCMLDINQKDNSSTAISNDKLDTTDKCIGTSILYPLETKPSDVEMDSFACQVSISHQKESSKFRNMETKDENSSLVSQPPLLNQNRKSCDNIPAKSSHEMSRNLYTDAMEEFLKGCNRFIESDNKGLDVSSPDHCVSFAIEKTSKSVSANTESPVTAKIVHSILAIVPKTKSEDKCVTNSQSGSCYPNEEMENSAEKECCNFDIKPQREDIDFSKKRSSNLSESPLSTHMLLATKVPLTPSEMLKFYGDSLFDKLSLSDNSTTDKKQTDTNSCLNYNHSTTFQLEPTSELAKQNLQNANDNNENQTETSNNVKDDSYLTFSESTVPIEGCEAINESSVFESPKVGQSPTEPSQASISLRRFAASSSNTNSAETPMRKKPPRNHKKIVPSLTDISAITTNSRLHSTALNDTRDKFGMVDEASFDISIIKANPTHDCECSSSADLPGNQASGTAASKDCAKAMEMSSTLQSTGNQSTIIYNWKTFWKGEPIPESARKKSKRAKKSSTTSESSSDEKMSQSELQKLSNAEIRDRLISLGFTPGPIAACREVYLRKLENHLNGPKETKDQPTDDGSLHKTVEDPKFSAELHGIILGRSFPTSVFDDDDMIRRQFEQPDPNLQWREGTMKNSFTYLLLDPRVTDKLPIRARDITEQESFKSFVGAIFYVGKGKQSRPYSHFHEALQTNRALYKLNPSLKVRHIHDIWNSGHGVISLHVFQSVIACEAYTREASMIEAIGLKHLTNQKRGDYYGAASSWDVRRKRLYGSFLVKKAMEVLMVEGERQIRPSNLKSHNTRQWTGCNAPIPPTSG